MLSSASTRPDSACARMSWISRASRVRSVRAAASAWAAWEARSWARRSSARAWAARARSCEILADRVKAPIAKTNPEPMSRPGRLAREV